MTTGGFEIGLEPTDVPLAKEASLVVFALEHFRDGDFALAHPGGVSGENAEAEWVTAGEATSASWRTERRGGVEAVELYPIGRHGIKMRCFKIGVSVKARIAPSLIVAHDHDDVGRGGFRESRKNQDKE